MAQKPYGLKLDIVIAGLGVLNVEVKGKQESSKMHFAKK